VSENFAGVVKIDTHNKIIPAITVLLAILITLTSVTGLRTHDFYSDETSNWQIQSRGQDMVDLFLVVPVLIITGFVSLKKNASLLLWAGALLYITYTFIIYCFDVHFNILFPAYCIILGLSFYAFLWVVYKHVINSPSIPVVKSRMSRITGIYFVVVSLSFYLLWLADIVPSVLNHSIPENIKQSGLPTNPVHVIDLSFFLPAVFITGVLLIRKKPIGNVLAIILLFFFVLMSITILWLTMEMMKEELVSDGVVIIAMTALATISFALLVWNLKEIQFRNVQLKTAGDDDLLISDQILKT